jgi:antitoxin (DNA-binding transcriptional repressor) of toxin-antitoxin stability system
MIVGLIFVYSSNEPRLFYDWSGIRQSVKDTVIIIADHGEVAAAIVGFDTVPPQQYHRRTWLIRNATLDELTKLTDYPNGAVKAMVYEGLIRKDSTHRFEILMQALQDTSTFFNYQAGCLGEWTMVGEYLADHVLELNFDVAFPPPPPPSGNNHSFSDEEINKIKLRYRGLVEKKQKYLQAYLE